MIREILSRHYITSSFGAGKAPHSRPFIFETSTDWFRKTQTFLSFHSQEKSIASDANAFLDRTKVIF
jgi:hypothetical protein